MAPVQFWLFHIERVSEQCLCFGFKLYWPIPHGEQSQRLALWIHTFPTLPKQAQVTMAPRNGWKANTQSQKQAPGRVLGWGWEWMHTGCVSQGRNSWRGGWEGPLFQWSMVATRLGTFATTVWVNPYFPNLTPEETEAQKTEVNCLSVWSWQATGLNLGLCH